MSRIYTGRGDGGYTSTLDGIRVRKNELRVDAYGTVDESSSALGLAKSLAASPLSKKITQDIQDRLICLAAELAEAARGGGRGRGRCKSICREDTEKLERYIQQLAARLPEQKGFSIPGATPASGAYDLARTIIRRAERLCVSLDGQISLNPEILKFLNRLSDLAYMLARCEEYEGLIRRVTAEVYRKMPAGLDCSLLNKAKELAGAAEDEARRLAVPMVITILDAAGNMVLCHRMDNSLLASIDISINKAYTAVALKMPTHKLAELCSPGQTLYGLQNTNNERIVIFGGGYPILAEGILIGGIGISGGTVQEDMQVAEEALRRVYIN